MSLHIIFADGHTEDVEGATYDETSLIGGVLTMWDPADPSREIGTREHVLRRSDRL